MGDMMRDSGGSGAEQNMSQSSGDEVKKCPQPPPKPSNGHGPFKVHRDMPLSRNGGPERQGIRLKVKGSQGVNILQALGSCLTSCESATSTLGMTSHNDVDQGAYKPSLDSSKDSKSTASLPGSISSLTSESQDGNDHVNNIPIFQNQPHLINPSNNLTRPQSMGNLASNRKSEVPMTTITPSTPEVLPKSGSLDGLHQAALYTKTRSRRSRIVTPPMMSRPRPFPKATPTNQTNKAPRAFREADGMEGRSSPLMGVAYSAGLLPPRAGGGAWSRGRATADWVQYLPRSVSMPPQVREDGEEDLEHKRPKQLQAYVAWVNSQLKKRPGTPTIDDLRQTQDGVALADLIEIIANERLEGIYRTPTTATEMMSNVDKVLHFMRSHRINMHHTTAPDIVQGNPKSIMRLILALAATYKPKSVKHSAPQQATSGSVSPRSHPTPLGIAHGAAAALAEARRDASVVYQRPRRPSQLDNRFQESGSESDGRAVADPEHGEGVVPPRGEVRTSRERGELEGASCGSSPRSSLCGSPKLARRLFGVHASASQDFEQGYQRGEEVQEVCEEAEHELLSADVAATKKALLQLQELLLSGQAPEGPADPEAQPCDGATSDEQLVVVRSQIQHEREVSRDLREELSRAKNDSMQLVGTKAGLQKRLADQEEAFLKMKAELLRVGFSLQSLQHEKSDLERKLGEADRVTIDLRRELAHRDRQIEELVASLQYQQQDKEMSTRALHAQIVDLHEKLQLVGDTEVSLSHRVANQDRKMALLEGKLLHTQFDGGQGSRPSSGRSTQSSNNDEIQMMRDSLQSLRTSFAGNDPTHHTIDTLEHSISSLMERLQMSEASRLSDSMNSTGRQRVNYDSTGDIRRSPISSLQVHGLHRFDSSSGSSGGSSTKVLYFTDRVVTPFMCTIPRRLGEITLRDFKGMFDRHGNYRFHFKAMDPEFGTVKEELTHDDDIIPGWEGKIVAWIEEDG